MRNRVGFSLFVRCVIAVAATSGCLASDTRESFELLVTQPPAVVTIEGRGQLVGELHLTNFSRNPLEVVEARVLDAQTEAPLAVVAGPVLAGVFCRLDSTAGCASGTNVSPGQRAIVYVDADVGERLRSKSLRYQIHYRSAGDDATRSVASAAVSIDARPSVLGPLLRGGPWVAVHHSEWPRGHRRVLYAVDGRARIPGRFAIDWVKADEQGHIARGDGDQVAAAFGYSADVLAVADGVVVAAREDMAESEKVSANPRHTLDEAAGNFIVLRLAADRFAIYEHLRPRSLRVKVGGKVRRGEVIASLGFTGDSTGPHLHLHVADGSAPVGSEGLAYVFDAFTLLGRYEDIGALGREPWLPRKDALTAERSHEWPGFNVVIRFPQ